MNRVIKMSNSDVFGSPMILTGRKPVSPFGAATNTNSSNTVTVGLGRRLARALGALFVSSGRDQRIRKTVVELSRLDDRMLRDIGLNRSAIVSVAKEAEGRRGRRFRR